MKTRHDNNMSDPIRVAYAKNIIELLWSIKLGVDYDENHIGQWRNWLYKCGLGQKQNWVALTDWILCCLWWKPDMTIM